MTDVYKEIKMGQPEFHVSVSEHERRAEALTSGCTLTLKLLMTLPSQLS